MLSYLSQRFLLIFTLQSVIFNTFVIRMAITDNIEQVYDRIARACGRCGRNSDEVQLVAVTKNVDVARIRTAIEAGVRVLGENRVQEALPKFQEIGSEVQWHMIGHLQRNKVKQALQFAEMIQSVDSLRLAREIQKQAGKLNRQVDILLEVNTSGEESKFGFRPEETLNAVREISSLFALKIRGLMTIGAFLPNPNDARPAFGLLRELGEQVDDLNMENVDMDILSMGMTDDFEVAIEEGATMVRIGRLIFGERPE